MLLSVISGILVMLYRILHFFLYHPVLTAPLLIGVIVWGLVHAPFGWDITGLPSDPVPVDAIPDLGENQQIVYTEWPGRSPQDIDDQVTYPLSTALLGIPGVKSIRSNSMVGSSSIYLIFEEDIEFYWSRSRVLEKISALPANILPDGVRPILGPDATAVGQVFWYTLEGRNSSGDPAGGWDPQTLRSLQDFQIGYALAATKGVAEVAAIGGFVKEYQVEIDPVAMKAYGVSVTQIMDAVRKSNLDVGAKTLEFNRVEYLIRGLGYIQSLEDLEETVVLARDNVPVRIKEVAKVQWGPADRRGGLDKGGAEAVGAVVVARYGSNPMAVIEAIKATIAEISPGLPEITLPDGSISKVTIVPFYDRSELIYETLGTLEEALTLEMLISMLVVIVLVSHLRASLLISSLLPIGVLMVFVAMRQTGVDANVVALSGIAIAIGVMVDVGIIFSENILRHSDMPGNQGRPLRTIVLEASAEVSPAVVTAILTTVVSFLPVFALQGAEGKLFSPLAFTKTYSMVAALLIGIVFVPSIATWLIGTSIPRKYTRWAAPVAIGLIGIVAMFCVSPWWIGLMVLLLGISVGLRPLLEPTRPKLAGSLPMILVLIAVVMLLSRAWLPLGAGQSLLANGLFVVLILGSILGAMWSMVYFYERVLGWCLDHRGWFLTIPVSVVLVGITVWQGPKAFLGWAIPAQAWEGEGFWAKVHESLPGLGSEFMPTLDEGSFLLMPSTMPHSGVEENVEVIRQLDLLVETVPEVERVVGKWGRVQSALDPAPISMFENLVAYKPEYLLDESGHRMRFRVDRSGEFVRDEQDALIPDPGGQYFRNWRDHIRHPDDIWQEIIAVAQLPGLTSAPKLQPIETRQIMVSTGMRAPMGLKVQGPDLVTIQNFGFELEALLRQVPSVNGAAVFADRVVGKPYLEIELLRPALARYGLSIEEVQRYLEVAVGGMTLTRSVEGRERYAIRVRYPREQRSDPERMLQLLVPTASGIQVPLQELAQISYEQGPQMIRSENTFLNGYVIFDKISGVAEMSVIQAVKDSIAAHISRGELKIPSGVSYRFAGNYENQVRANERLSILIPVCLLLIFMILYLQFRSATLALLVFTGVAVALSGGFILLWLYGWEHFLDGSFWGENLRDIFQIGPIYLSVAVWVGFIALFGIATDDGVLMGTYLQQAFDQQQPTTRADIRLTVIQAGAQRIRPAMMTTATTVIALFPVITSTGKGADIMAPMAVPILGGMIFQVMTVLVVPVLFAWLRESSLNRPSPSNP